MKGTRPFESMSFELDRLESENAKLQAEIERLCTLPDWLREKKDGEMTKLQEKLDIAVEALKRILPYRNSEGSRIARSTLQKIEPLDKSGRRNAKIERIE